MGASRANRHPRRVALGITLLLARVLAVVGGGAGLALTDTALTAPPAAAHNVAQGNTRVFLAPDDADRLLDRAEAGGGGIQTGDVLDYIIQFEPIDNGATTGVGGYVTFYPPSFTEVVGAAVVDHVGNDFVDVPVAEAGPIHDGPGTRGTQSWGAPFAAADQGSLAQLYGDTGIWYSTSPETAKYVGDGVDPDLTPLGDNGYVVDPTACSQLDGIGFCRAHNLWDREMVYRFGDNSFADRIVPSGRGNTPHGAGSPVAGPDTHYGLDWRAEVGPWTRVAYPGSQTGTGGAPVTDPGAVAPTDTTAWVPTSAGVVLDESNPDHDDITAVRWAVGRLTADPDSTDDLMWVRVQLRFTSPPTSCPVDAEVFGGDADVDDAGKDNMWRYYVPVPAFGAACLTLDKVGPTVVEPNGEITYTIRIGNITATPLTGVVVSDPLPAGTTFVSAGDGGTLSGGVVTWPTIATLDAGETRDLTVTVQAPGTIGTTVTNEVTVVTDQTGLVADRWDTVTAAEVADLFVTKTDTVDPVVQGQDLEYTVTVTNEGPSTAVDATVTDDLPPGTTLVSATPSVGTCSGPGPVSCSLGDLAPGASATVAVVLDGAAPGTVVNTATATSATPDADPADNTDDEATEVLAPNPSIAVAKTVYAGHDGGAGCPGGESVAVESGGSVTWCFAVTNTGDVALQDVTVDDLDLGVDDGNLGVVAGDLASVPPGGSVVLFHEGAATDDLTNTVAVSGTPAGGQPVTDTDTASVDILVPGVTIDKAVYRGHDGGVGCPGAASVAVRSGDPVTWCFVVTNTGDTPLSALDVTDPDLGLDPGDLVVPLLAPGASATRYVEGTVDGDLTNTASVVGTSPGGDQPTDEDTAAVDEVHPAVTVAKTVYAGQDAGASCPGTESVGALAGDDLTWCFVVTNTGDVDLTDLRLDDPALGVDQSDLSVDSGDLASLPVGASLVAHLEGAATTDLANSVTVTATAPVGPDVSDDDGASVDVVAPGVDIQKTVYGGHDGGAGCPGADRYEGEAGAPVTWCFTLTNIGDTTLADLVLDDPALGVGETDATVVVGDLADMGPGESTVLAVEGTLDGDLTNSATVAATPPVGPPVTDEDTAEVAVLAPGVTIAKSVYAGHDGGASCAGGEVVVTRSGAPVTWCFVVTNTGQVALDVTVDDPAVGYTGTADDLAPGASTTLWAEGAVDGDLANTATATGTTPVGDEVQAADGAAVDEVHPAVRVDKTVYLGHDGGAGCDGGETVDGEVGQPVTWCFTVTNTGDTPLSPLTLDDPLLGVDQSDLTVDSGTFSSLAPGNSIRTHLESTVTGGLTNTATVVGEVVDGSTVTDGDTASVGVIGPQIGVAKAVVDGPTGNGDGTYTLTYRVRVANAGETPLVGVQVTDDLTSTFAGAASFTVDGLSSGDLTVNAGFDGRPGGSTDLLAGTDALGVGERGDIEVTVTVDPGDDLGPYENVAHATGSSPRDDTVEDWSDSGTDADPSSTNPDEPGDTGGSDDPVPVAFPAVDLTVDKVAAGVRVDGGQALVDWRITVTNRGPGDDPGPITLVDALEARLDHVSAEGDGWVCDAVERDIACVWDAPLPAGDTTAEIRVLTATPVDPDDDRALRNDARVESTAPESRLDNNDDRATATVTPEPTEPTSSTPPGSLPRTGAAVGNLLLLGLGLVLSGRFLQRRNRVMT